MKNVLIIGASSMVGSRYLELNSLVSCFTPDLNSLDITDQASINKYFAKNASEFDTVVNFAAYTDVLAADKEAPDKNGLAWKLNVLAPEYLAQASLKYHKFLIHFSTDFVFEGLNNFSGPFIEVTKLPEQPTNLCWYGWTKNQGEKKVLETNINCAIVRIANPFRSHYGPKLDLARKILDLYDKNSLFPLFTDQIITPLFVDDINIPLSILIHLKLPGIYHFASSDSCSYYDFGNYLIEKTRGQINAPQKTSLVEFLKIPGRNKRPIWGGLAVKNTEKILDFKFDGWKDMVDNFAKQLVK